MKAVIFLGPSLPIDDARAVLPDAVYLPPARQADLLSAVGIHRPDVIGLIDGEFGQSLSVWHKEILFALDRGVAVYGASSMGALRAAETAPFGTRGVGRIFHMYANGELTDDDEVALAHGPGDVAYRKFSEPMVNVRATFERAHTESVIDGPTCQCLVRVAKALFFADRTFPRILEDAASAGIPAATLEAVGTFARDRYVDLKRQDAIELLRAVGDHAAPRGESQATFEFQRTPLFEGLYNRDRKVRHDDFDVPLVCIANWAALHLPGFSDLNFHALNRGLVALLAALLEVRATAADIEQEEQRFRISRRLADDAAVELWQRRHDLDPQEFRELLTELAVCRRLQRWLISSRVVERTTRLVLDELRLHGDYEGAASAAAQQERILDEHHPNFKERGFRDLSLEQLLIDHLRSTRCDMHVNYKPWAEEAGFHMLTDLRVELLRARLAREYASEVADSLAILMEQPDAASASADAEA
jgi:hypothetical protein